MTVETKQTSIAICGSSIDPKLVYVHFRNCKICQEHVKELLEGSKYNYILQDLVDEYDFVPLNIVKNFVNHKDGFPIPLGYVAKRMEEKLKRDKIFPRNGKYECVCGVKFKKKTLLSNHKTRCQVFKDAKKDFLKVVLDPENLNKFLINEGLTVLEYLNVLDLGDFYKNNKNVLYSLALTEIDKLIKGGKLNYKKLSVSDLLRNERLKEKQKNTIKEKYGVENVSQSDEIKRKKEETSLKNYGVKYHTQNKKQMEKIQKTLEEKYGVTNISQLEEIKQKKKETFIKHYGVDNIFKRIDIMNIHWEDKLEVVNPMYLKDDLKNSGKMFSFRTKKVIDGIGYIILSDIEYDLLKKLLFLKKEKYSNLDIYLNNMVLVSNKRDSAYYLDFMLDNYYPAEVKNTMIHIKKDKQKYYRVSKERTGNFILLSKSKNIFSFYLDLLNQEKVYYYIPFNQYGNMIADRCKKFSNKDIKFKNLCIQGITSEIEGLDYLISILMSHKKKYIKQLEEKLYVSRKLGYIFSFQR